jgi:hypothetical protein
VVEPLAEITEVVEKKAPAGLDPETGQFLPGNKLASNANGSPQKRVTAWLQRKLMGAQDDMQEIERIVTNIIDIANNKDPKGRKEAVWAFNALMDRAYGTHKSDEELDAMRQSGVQIAIITVPGQSPEVVCSQPKALIAADYDPE